MPNPRKTARWGNGSWLSPGRCLGAADLSCHLPCPRAMHRELAQQQEVLGERDRSGRGLRAYFFNRNLCRRFFVNRLRNERRRTERFWKHTESARYLLERLLHVGPVQ